MTLYAITRYHPSLSTLRTGDLEITLSANSLSVTKLPNEDEYCKAYLNAPKDPLRYKLDESIQIIGGIGKEIIDSGYSIKL